MWAAPIFVRAGPRLVGVRTVPSQQTRLAGLLQPWTVASADAVPAAFDVVLEEVDGQVGRLVPQLRHGSCVIARARTSEPVEQALLQVLGDLAERDRRDAVRMRLFVKGDRAVLASLAHPALVGDASLRAVGVREVTCLHVVVDGDGAVGIGPDLAGESSPQRWRLAQVIEVADDADRGASAAWLLSARGNGAAWLQVLDGLGDRIVRVTTPDAVRDLIVADLA